MCIRDSNDPELIHAATIALFSYPVEITLKNMNKDNKADVETNKQVITCDTLSPRVLPKKPDIIEPIKGKNNIKYSTLSF